jgi:hypothetical protein
MFLSLTFRIQHRTVDVSLNKADVNWYIFEVRVPLLLRRVPHCSDAKTFRI